MSSQSGRTGVREADEAWLRALSLGWGISRIMSEHRGKPGCLNSDASQCFSVNLTTNCRIKFRIGWKHLYGKSRVTLLLAIR